MSRNRSQLSDPRTIAREIAGVFEAVFPQLVPAVVRHFNQNYSYSIDGCTSISAQTLDASSLQRAMLFELAVAAAESLVTGERETNWEACLEKACARQEQYYDAEMPDSLDKFDIKAASQVAENLAAMLRAISVAQSDAIVIEPRIPGFRWIASGVGDFSTRTSIIEAKCTSKHFSTADYRQIVIYWLLAYIEGLERDERCWSTGILLNPRLNFVVEFDFSNLVSVITVQRSLIETVEAFGAIIDDGSALEGNFMYVHELVRRATDLAKDR